MVHLEDAALDHSHVSVPHTLVPGRTKERETNGTEEQWRKSERGIVGCVITVVMNCGPCANRFIITSNLYPLRVIRGLCFNMVVG